jgi:4-amino-4-deoxy-L-arabinose transferase-like glycosyltransferase
MTARPDAARAQPELSAWWVLAGAWLWLGCTASLRTLFLPDEGRYVGVAWEMAHSGNWLTPTLDGMPFFHKPPLFYWLTAAALDAFGPVEWAARLASVGSAGLAVVALYLFVRRWLGNAPARWSAFVLASQPMYFAAAQFANLDMLVASCIAAAVLLAAHAALQFESAAPYRRPLAAAYVAVALGVLAKGLIGLVLPCLVLLVWLASAARWRSVRALLWWPGLGLAALVAAPWMAAMQQRHAGFLNYFIVVQHFERYAQTGFNSVEPAWFYVPVLAVLTLPWSPWLLRGVGRSPAAAADPARLRALAWSWLGVVVVFFSVPQSKLIGYILPALPPLALLVVQGAGGAPQRHGPSRRLWRACAVTAPVLCLCAVAYFAHDNPKSWRDTARIVAADYRSGQGIAVLDDYVYDLGFYLRDTPVLLVVADWTPTEVAAHDNWRKELADAGGFAPDLARQRLIDRAELTRRLCGGAITWIVARHDQVQRYPFLAAAQPVETASLHPAWRIDSRSAALRSALGCTTPPGTTPATAAP